jgi:release factor glutamine methyltransferase|tara:strand:+ start:849 stop:1469 length:621 start_codon:yes stop_codon:yes gene_type:complete
MKSNIIEFEKFKIETDNKVFSPRIDVEIFVQAIQGIIRKDSKILELGTGTGAISIALAKNYKDISILATDINKFAIKIAKKNSEINKVDKIIDFKESNWFSNIKDNKYDFIITNPPYIPKENSSIFSKLSDPKNSLYANKNGLADIYTIIKNSLNYLNNNSYLLIEHAHYQTLILKEYAKKFGFSHIKSQKDDLGFNRISIFLNRF